VPLLDHRVVEFAWRLPRQARIRGGTGKWALREVLARHVPRALFERTKRGFSVPLAAWLRGPLKSWAEELLDPSRIERQGLLHAAPVQNAWREHVAGTHNREHALWAVLMLQAWLEENRWHCA
jgi:asparagine synthase (glutamine-hydrolysing)